MSAKIVRTAFGVLWLLAVGAGFVLLSNYQSASGTSGPAPQYLPPGQAAILDGKRDTLIMFAHPRCPCTRASLEELNRLLARSSGNIAVRVMFYRPGDLSSEWAQTDLWRSAAAIPGVSVREDIDGILARQLGAETSGYVLLYDPKGKLLFSGGITASRGHAGDNAGEDAILSLASQQTAQLNQTPVYGCSLLGNCKTSEPDIFQ